MEVTTKELTQEDLDKMPHGIFRTAQGLITHPWFNDAHNLYNEKGERWIDQDSPYGKAASEGYTLVKVNWVATRGDIADWAIYHSLDSNLEKANYLSGDEHLEFRPEYVAAHGAKLYTFGVNKDKIQEFVPNTCMDSYRNEQLKLRK